MTKSTIPNNQDDQKPSQAPAASNEIELKFTLAPKALKALMGKGLDWPDAVAPVKKPLMTRYYDTPNRFFWRHGIALRVRRKGDHWLQNLKWRGVATKTTTSHETLAGGSIRTEWEWPLSDDQPNIEVIEDALAANLRLPKNLSQKLQLVFETDISRSVQKLKVDDISIVEVAYDFGVVRAGAAERILSEVELELEEGHAHDLYRVASALTDQTGARLAGGSKAELGYNLALNNPPKAVKSTAAPLSQDDTSLEALKAQAAQTLQDLLANQAVVLADSGPEGVHQMRVALRRLDAIVRPLETCLFTPAAQVLLAELKWLRQSLGHIRNWDVFVTETLPNVAKSAHSDLLRPVAKTMRQEAQQGIVQALNDPRYADLLIKLAQLADGAAPFAQWPQASHSAIHSPFRGRAARWFIETMAAMEKQGPKLATMAPDKQHRFRLKVKKTRYIADILVPIDVAKPLRKTAKQMAKLQDGLGEQNDAFTALELLDDMQRHPMLAHDVKASKAIAHEQKRLKKHFHKPVPQITEQWQRIMASFDEWLMARRTG